MARISNYMSDSVDAPSVRVDDKEIRIIAGGFWLTVSREESIQLEADSHAINTQAAAVEQEVAA